MNIAAKIAMQAAILLILPMSAFCDEKKTITDHLQMISRMTDSLQKVNVEEYTESVIPPFVKELFPTLKHELLAVITETINDKKVRWNDRDITVEKPEHHDDLIAVSATLEIICGEDTSFYLFKKEKDKWRLVFLEEANGYEEISGAHGSFGYSIFPPDKKGRFFIVTANIRPWCTSNWQELNYTIYRPSQDAYRPTVLLKKNETIYLGNDFAYKLDTDRDRMTLKFAGSWCSTPDYGASNQSVTYKIGVSSARRIKKTCRRD